MLNKIVSSLREAVPLAVRESRNAIYDAVGVSLPEAWAVSDTCTMRNNLTDDAKEGPRAFSEKRPPLWKAR
ncbi:MAG: hypothetical protein ACYCWL_17475 [Thauera sp.]